MKLCLIYELIGFQPSFLNFLKVEDESFKFNFGVNVIAFNVRQATFVFVVCFHTLQKHVYPHQFDDGFYNGTKVYCSFETHVLDDWFPSLTINLPSSTQNQTISLTVYPSSYLQVNSTISLLTGCRLALVQIEMCLFLLQLHGYSVLSLNKIVIFS